MSDLGGLFSLRGYRAAGTTVGAGHRSTLTWLLHSFRMTVRLRSSTLTVKVPAVRSAKAKAPRSSEVVMAIQSGQQVEMVTSILASHTWPAMRAWAQRVGIGVAVGPRVPVGVVCSPASGSVLLLVLFACLAVSVLCLSLTSMFLAGQELLAEQADGRAEMANREQALGELLAHALSSWTPASISLPDGAGGRLDQDPSRGDYLMTATVTQASHAGPRTLAMEVERGRDGLDLPQAAIVAHTVRWGAGRESAVLSAEESSSVPPLVATVTPCEGLPGPSPLAHRIITEPWRLDPGSVARFSQEGSPGREWDQEQPEDGVVFLPLSGQTLAPLYLTRFSSDEPFLLVARGEGRLDLSGLEELWGVLVVDGGSLRLEGTILRGAVFVTGELDAGETGGVVYSPSILSWARDRSCRR